MTDPRITDIDDSSDTSLPHLDPDEVDDGPTIEEARAAAHLITDEPPLHTDHLPTDVKTGNPELYD